MKFFFSILTGAIVFVSCKNTAGEDPLAVAKIYCGCIQAQLSNAPDSSVNLTECEMKTMQTSRLLKIYVDSYENSARYEKSTLDSAKDFSLRVRDIEDSMCYHKIDFKKIKQTPHIRM